MLDIREIQFEHLVWEKKNFDEVKIHHSIYGLIEELGELAHAQLKMEQGIRIDEDHNEKAKDAVGDIIIFLISYCNKRGFDLERIIHNTWLSVKSRNWKKNPVNGE